MTAGFCRRESLVVCKGWRIMTTLPLIFAPLAQEVRLV